MAFRAWDAGADGADERALTFCEAQLRDQSVCPLSTFALGHTAHAEAALEKQVFSHRQVPKELLVLEQEAHVLTHLLEHNLQYNLLHPSI